MSHSIVFHWNNIDSYIHDEIKCIHPGWTFEALPVFEMSQGLLAVRSDMVNG